MNHVLIVEDSPHIMRLIQVNLERAGFAVSVANGGEQALQRLAHEPAIDLIITEIMMPVMDGFELIRNIRQQSVLDSVPILVMGPVRNQVRPDDPPGRTTKEIEEQARHWIIKYGANEFIVTPFNPGELVEKVRTMLARR